MSYGFMSLEIHDGPFVTVTRPNGESYSCPKGYENLSDGDTAKDEPKGFWHRLSASGYMDCTDWSGPFPTEAEAREDASQMYDICACGADLDEDYKCTERY